jgi:hypothetical protein
MGKDLIIIEASLSHSDTKIGWTPLGEGPARRRELYLSTHNTHTQETHLNAAGGNRTRNPGKPASADLRIRQRSHWDRQLKNVSDVYKRKDFEATSNSRFVQISRNCAQACVLLNNLKIQI